LAGNAKVHTAAYGVGFLLIGVAAAFGFASFQLSSLIKSSIPVQGVSIFAVVYLEAQFIERIVEPFSEQGGSKQEQSAPKGSTANPPQKTSNDPLNKGVQLFGDWQKIDKLEYQAAHPKTKGGPGLSPEDSEKLNQLKTQRAISLWGFSSLLGILLSYFTMGLFQLVGTTFVWGLWGHAIDSIFSGVIIGGGTKPLHDVIEYLQDPKSKSS